MGRKAKIVATLGPSSQDEDTVHRLIQAGMDVARLNFSHGTQQTHADRIILLRKLSEKVKKPIPIMMDLQGPKLRLGILPDEGIRLSEGQQVILSPTADAFHEDSAAVHLPFDVPELARSVRPKNKILLDDGRVQLQVLSTSEDTVLAKVMIGGLLTSHKGVNLPGANLNVPGFTEKDRSDLLFGLHQGIDLVAISFVREARDVDYVRGVIQENIPEAAKTPIIAKLELPEAIQNLHEILHAADGVMVARGDLAVETSPSLVPITQKKIIELANRHNKIVITATQMLESMMNNPRPTRAEASDVANAVLDGTDAVMLSGETASGSYPIESIKMMDSIVREAELHFAEWGHRSTYPDAVTRDDAISLTRAARELAQDRNVAGIAVFTQSGRTALLMSKARPLVPILAFTPEERTCNRLGLLWGVKPFLIPFASSVEQMLAHVEEAIVHSTLIKPGQQVVLISGFPVGSMCPPNFALLHTISDGRKNSCKS